MGNLIKKYLGESKYSKKCKNIDKIDENGMLMESRGGWMINMLGDLEEAFNSDAGFFNGHYPTPAETKAREFDRSRLLTESDHKNLIKALKSLSNVMAKAYKGKLIGF